MIEWTACTGLSEQNLHAAPQDRIGLREKGRAFAGLAFQGGVVQFFDFLPVLGSQCPTS
jgi:hypothetical protein